MSRDGVADRSHLARRYGTPLYVYDAARIHRAADRLRAALPSPHRLYYSVKANPSPAVLRQLTGLGLPAEVSSAGELAVALDAGQPAEQVLYTGPGKTPTEVTEAIAAGVRLFSVESAEDHRRLAALAAEHGTAVGYLIRVNGRPSRPAGGLRMTGRPSQFGIDLDALWSIPGLFTGTPAARPVGLHFFPVTNMTDEAALAAEFTASVETAAAVLHRSGLDATVLDLGGGFAAPFARPGESPGYQRLAATLAETLDTRLAGWRAGRPVVAFEAGRYLVAECGTLLSTVLDVKRSGGRTFVVLDAGINNLGGVSATGRLLPPSAQPVGPDAPDAEPVTLVGPLCTPLDVLGRDARLPDPRVGDVVAIPNVGAYGLTASVLGFLSRPPPTEVLVDATDRVVAVTTWSVRAVEQPGPAGGAAP
ncbi:type III PLP-dependent enzyme [Plantactinospora sp. CA-294935]|uniref:type III PLP-dependent enzyme n=1 Tax=Plantactinospora sp. CA-294935 TaxID=3240012 RepID=UPI003D8FA378